MYSNRPLKNMQLLKLVYIYIYTYIYIYIFTSYTTINIIIHTIKCYMFNGYMFRSPLRLSSGQLLQIVPLLNTSPAAKTFNSDFSPYIKKLCTHFGIPYCKHIEGARSVKVVLMMVARVTETYSH